MHKLLAGAAAFALAATAAVADPGGGKGNDRGGGKPAAQMNAKQEKGPGARAAKQERGPAAKPDRAGADRVAKAERGPPARAERGAGKADKVERRVEREQRPAQVERQLDRRGNGNSDRDRVIVERFDDDDRRVRRVTRVVDFDFDRNRGLIDGCPPGLAKKRNGCMPPGLLKNRGDDDFRFRRAFYRPDWWGFGSLGDRVFYDDGYLYRLGSNNAVLGYVPLLGGALSVGNVWPSFYDPVPVPDYYVDYYNLGPMNSYRYADDVIYRVDPETAAITSIAALLTGEPITVGQRMPLGYDVYNVPYPYRDRYFDRPDALYRYSDGYVYQIDPTTQLVAAAIQLLV